MELFTSLKCKFIQSVILFEPNRLSISYTYTFQILKIIFCNVCLYLHYHRNIKNFKAIYNNIVTYHDLIYKYYTSKHIINNNRS